MSHGPSQEVERKEKVFEEEVDREEELGKEVGKEEHGEEEALARPVVPNEFGRGVTHPPS